MKVPVNLRNLTYQPVIDGLARVSLVFSLGGTAVTV